MKLLLVLDDDSLRGYVHVSTSETVIGARSRGCIGDDSRSATSDQGCCSVKLTVEPLTPDRWPDLEAVFKARGCSVARSCWCMAYRLSGSGEPLPRGMTRAAMNRARLKALVDAGNPPGLIGYRGKEAVGWVSIGPREQYAKLKLSPVMKAVDEQPVWSIICFVVPTEHRGQGVAQALLNGAVTYARKQGARLVEAYPVDKRARSNDDTMWFGAKAMYDKAGFKEVSRRKPHRPVVRMKLRSGT